MKKIILSWLLILCLILPSVLVACDDTATVPSKTETESTEEETTTEKQDPPEQPNEPENPNNNSGTNNNDNPNKPSISLPIYPRPSNVRTYPLTEQTAGIKVLGERRAKIDGCITMDWTGAGVEFNVDLNTKSTVSFVAKSNDPCYFKAYVDGVLWKNGTSNYFTVAKENTTLELKNIPYGKHAIRLVKATGYTLALAQLYSVTLDGTISETTPAKNDLYIEFLGDSISCGWGIMGNYDGTYESQDGTQAYPYRLATRLNADYSILALSGRGVIYGSPNFDKNYLHASPSRSTAEHDFARQADIVIINLGTNEEGNNASASDFGAGYLRLLETIFQKNGDDCAVYCLYGAMNSAYSARIHEAVNAYLASHTNAKIYTLQLERSTTPGGSPTWGHPGFGDNTKYLFAIEAKLNETYFNQ